MEPGQVALHAEGLDQASAFCSRLLSQQPVGRFDEPGLLFFRLGQVISEPQCIFPTMHRIRREQWNAWQSSRTAKATPSD
jgi:hypothetical protein